MSGSEESADLNGASEKTHEPSQGERHGVPQIIDARGIEVLFPEVDQLKATVKALADEGFAQLLDVFGVDYLTHPGREDLPPSVTARRFEVVYILLSHAEHRRLRLRVQVAESDARVPSMVELHPGAESPEREAFDMFGITFDDHPDLSRILMPDDWEGHPLRKDFDLGQIPVQFKGAPTAR